MAAVTCTIRMFCSKRLGFSKCLSKYTKPSWQYLLSKDPHNKYVKTTLFHWCPTYEPKKRLFCSKIPLDLDSDTSAPLPEERGSKRRDNKNTGVKVFESVGKFIPHDILDLMISDDQTHVGITRKEAMKLKEQSNLKLVLINSRSKPNPLYKLMSGRELHQERMKAKEVQEKEKKPTETKEMTISENIGQHDLETKKKQIKNWMENAEHQYHVRVTVMHKRSAKTPTTEDDKMKIINDILRGLNEITINGPPKKCGRNGDSIRVTLRHMSAKEKLKQKKENET
ncbi:translation initiation factor IF-3, mitochondrial-like [Antedon mediterranea]|uniref:translation initiation factor IF-3, mitochondrial-like n=1 Tax=Antedon mediterranea TaxID=105859 RepID=UPI003AF45D05